MSWDEAKLLAKMAGYDLAVHGMSLVVLSKRSGDDILIWQAWSQAETYAQTATHLLKQANGGAVPDEIVVRR